MNWRGRRYVALRIDPGRDQIRLVWRRDGQRYGSLAAVERRVRAEGRELVLATNAGMFHPNMRPVGLHIEGGRVVVPLETRHDLPGNFFLEPNGVFFVEASGAARILTTEAFAKRAPDPSVRLATQSGPMLVLDGRIHPAFSPSSAHRNIRSGVGTCGEGRIAFAISLDPVTFHEFATFFRDRLGCARALYLDGAISKLHAPTRGRRQPGGDFAGILYVARDR